ncbi:MAG: WS/DGAT/MGAT family O-acyltransferase [Kofleriaceae bacterium]
MGTKRLSPSDAMFLYGETRETMFHVAGMMPFTPAPGTPPDHLRDLMDEIRESPVCSPWNRQLKTPDTLRNPLHTWIEVDDVDREYHVRRSALPTPGDERELGILVSRLHSYPIDFHRPPWEVHLIEGLEGGRFALYVKVHHALVDGFSAMRVLSSSLSKDPDDRTRPLFFSQEKPPRAPREAKDEVVGIQFQEFLDAFRSQYGASKIVARAVMNVVRSSRAKDNELVSPRHAPKCILNAKIGRSRRFATQNFAFARIKEIARKANGTINDVILALCAGSLRRYLVELDALPAQPLVAMLPVSVRAKDDEGGGNSVGAILASLATDVHDPAERLAAIVASTTNAKRQLQGMTKAAILQYSALLCAPAMINMIPYAAGAMKPTFNIVISNVPGPEEPRYFRGARLEASYPMSIPVHGQALNITCNSYAGRVCFGFTGCRDSVPRLQRLAVYCNEAMSELEQGLE